MKLVIYTLNVDGTVPDYILNGGYLAVPNDKPSPQNYDLIGVTDDSNPRQGFESEEALLEYAQSNNLNYVFDVPQTTIPLETIVSGIWSKI